METFFFSPALVRHMNSVFGTNFSDIIRIEKANVGEAVYIRDEPERVTYAADEPDERQRRLRNCRVL